MKNRKTIQKDELSDIKKKKNLGNCGTNDPVSTTIK